MIKLEVEREQAKARLDRLLAQALPAFSRARLQTLIRDGFVTLNGKHAKAARPVRTGDIVELREPEIEKIDAQPEDIPLEILFEDADLRRAQQAGRARYASRRRPSAAHPGQCASGALQNLSGIGGKERPGHRPSAGQGNQRPLGVAKNDMTHRDLSNQFAARTMRKIYLALVAGTLRKNQRRHRQSHRPPSRAPATDEYCATSGPLGENRISRPPFEQRDQPGRVHAPQQAGPIRSASTSIILGIPC